YREAFRKRKSSGRGGLNRAALVIAAMRADAVRLLRFMALWAFAQRGLGQVVVRAARARPSLRMSSLWIRHCPAPLFLGGTTSANITFRTVVPQITSAEGRAPALPRPSLYSIISLLRYFFAAFGHTNIHPQGLPDSTVLLFLEPVLFQPGQR